jgi:hypothetical protein
MSEDILFLYGILLRTALCWMGLAKNINTRAYLASGARYDTVLVYSVQASYRQSMDTTASELLRKYDNGLRGFEAIILVVLYVRHKFI